MNARRVVRRLTGLVAFVAVLGLLTSQIPVLVEELTGNGCRAGYVTAVTHYQTSVQGIIGEPPVEQLTALAGLTAEFVAAVKALPCRGSLEAGLALVVAAGERFANILDAHLAGQAGTGEVYTAAEEFGNAMRAFKAAVDE